MCALHLKGKMMNKRYNQWDSVLEWTTGSGEKPNVMLVLTFKEKIISKAEKQQER